MPTAESEEPWPWLPRTGCVPHERTTSRPVWWVHGLSACLNGSRKSFIEYWSSACVFVLLLCFRCVVKRQRTAVAMLSYRGKINNSNKKKRWLCVYFWTRIFKEILWNCCFLLCLNNLRENPHGRELGRFFLSIQ